MAPVAESLSVVIPAHDEAGNLAALCGGIARALEIGSLPYEIVVADDASSDATPQVLAALARQGLPVATVRLPRRSGQSAALQAGFDRCSGTILATLDGDGQNDPSDLPRMIARLREGQDLVCGVRRRRADPFFSRQLPSRAANALIRWGTGIPLHDVGCGLRVFRRELLAFRWEDPVHRFFPLVAAWQGARVCEMEVAHHPRSWGRAKYGWGRAMRFAGDLRRARRLALANTEPAPVIAAAPAAAAEVLPVPERAAL